mmetsp:Transcript_19194/g.36754  ORF Transcript_19194/g.36754 Transcript_19194/m.36754 type:complete len:220 (-) Transcript_19194:51-710(-)
MLQCTTKGSTRSPSSLLTGAMNARPEGVPAGISAQDSGWCTGTAAAVEARLAFPARSATTAAGTQRETREAPGSISMATECTDRPCSSRLCLSRVTIAPSDRTRVMWSVAQAAAHVTSSDHTSSVVKLARAGGRSSLGCGVSARRMGARLSRTRSSAGESVHGLPARSRAAPASTQILTRPSVAVGLVTVAVYTGCSTSHWCKGDSWPPVMDTWSAANV